RLRLRFRARRAHQSHRLPSPHPARRQGCQDAFPDPPTHAAPCLWVQTRQRWPRHTGSATLPWAQEHSAHRALHQKGARSLQEHLALTAVGAGKLGIASPSITLAFAAASRLAIISLISSIPRSICSVVISLSGLPCSTLCSHRFSHSL